MKVNVAGKFPILAILILIGGFIAGCKSTPKVDWDARVGSYTYDQAVTDLGPPDKQAKLTDGYTVAEWITHHSSGSGLSFGTGFFSGGGGGDSAVGGGVGQSVGSGSSDKTLKLTFGTNNVLTAWSKN